jgi:hypothetical protein
MEEKVKRSFSKFGGILTVTVRRSVLVLAVQESARTDQWAAMRMPAKTRSDRSSNLDAKV